MRRGARWAVAPGLRQDTVRAAVDSAAVAVAVEESRY